MNTKKIFGYGLLAVMFALAFTVLSLTGCDDDSPAAHKHQWGEWETVTPATCTEAGEEKRVCKTNATHIETREQPALGHDWEEQSTTIPATETQNGGTGIFCKRDQSHLQEGGIVEWATGSAGLEFTYVYMGDSDDGYSAGKGTFAGTTLHIPAYWRPVDSTDYNDYKLVTELYVDAFKDCTNITAVTFAAESQLTTINSSVFYACTSLASITLPASLTTISETAFSQCTSLANITLPAGLTTINRSTFSGCSSLTSITLPTSVTTIGEWAFGNCTGLTSITIPEGVTTIGNNAFYYCTGLTSVTIGEGVTEIGDLAFGGCTGLTSITIPASVANIGTNVFFECAGLAAITVNPNNQNFVSEGGILYNKAKTEVLFVPPALTSFVIPEGITTITVNLLRNTLNITSITIPASVTNIDEGAFSNCTKLASLTVDANNPNYASDNNILYNKAKTAIIFVPREISSITLPNSLTTIGDMAFAGCSKITSINIPASVTSIGSRAFTGTNLTGITVDANNPNYASDDNILYDKAKTALLLVTTEKSGVFTIPTSVTSIGDMAFSYCRNITSISIPASVTSIGNQAFFFCTSLTSVTFVGTISSSGFSTYAFYSTSSSLGDLRNKFYATDSANGTPGTYTRSGSGTTEDPHVWAKQ